ncbi:MAG: hypothetical protein DRJ01_01215 [Bacteroidetes bacterium]|nr:MAG: hypothetical protein DRJ01_01215 [Bacteroidota bacterium]
MNGHNNKRGDKMYLYLTKTLRANKFAEWVKETGEGIIQVKNADSEYYNIWDKAALHNGLEKGERSYSNCKPWSYITYKPKKA